MTLLMHIKMAQKKWNRTFKAMGTDIVIDIVGDQRCVYLAKKSFDASEIFFERIEQIFSRFRSDSELSCVNCATGSYVHVSEEFIDVVERALHYHDRTQGYFDPRIHDALVASGYVDDFHTQKPHQIKTDVHNSNTITGHTLSEDLIIDRSVHMVCVSKKIDLAGIVKGWAVDQARQLMYDAYDGFIIDAGGDMWVHGSDIQNKSWYIGIEGIADDLLLLKVKDHGIATSGVTRRQWIINEKKYHHLIDPHVQKPSHPEASTVTVIGETVEFADIWAKVLFLMGRNHGMDYANAHNIKVIWIDHNLKIYASQKIQENIV